MTSTAASLALRYAIRKRADLNPPLGDPGGRCYLMRRVLEKVRTPSKAEDLITKVEDADSFSQQEDRLVYKDDLEESAVPGTRIKKVLIDPHAQARMDLRGVTVEDVKKTLGVWYADYIDKKANPKRRYEFEIAERGILAKDRIVFPPSGGKTQIVFSLQRKSEKDWTALVWSAWGAGRSDPPPKPRERCEDFVVRPRTADLHPALGYPGGPCQVIERIDTEVPNPRLRENLVDSVESGKDLSNPEAHKVYSLLKERGPSGTKFESLLITPHAQYRMDLRGVNVSDLRLFFKRFNKALNDARSTKSPLARRWESDMSWGTPIEWTDSAGLTVVFKASGKDVHLITTYWKGVSDPRPVSEDSCALPSRSRVAKRFLAGERLG